MTRPENEAPPWWSAGVLGPRPFDDLQRRGDYPESGDPLWRFTNRARCAVVLDAPGHEPTAVADPERPGVVLALGPVEDLAEPSPSSRPPR